MWVRTAISDGRSCCGLRRREGGVDGVHVVAVADRLHVPAVRLEARADVLGEGQIGRAVDGDVIVVVEDDEPAETLMPGEGGSF